MATSLDGSLNNAPPSSTSSTPSLTSNAPVKSTHTTGPSGSLSRSSHAASKSSSASHSGGHISVASPTATSRPPSVRSLPAKADEVSSKSTSMTEATSVHSTSKSNSKSADSPTDGPVPHPSPSAPHPPASSAHTSSAAPTHRPSSVSQAPSRPSSASRSETHVAQITEANVSEKNSATGTPKLKVSTPTNSETSISSTASSSNTTHSTQSLVANITTHSSSSTLQTAVRVTATSSKGNNSAAAHQLVTDFSSLISNGQASPTSGGTPVSPSGILSTSHAQTGFFANHAAVVGVFVVVGLIVLGIVGFFFFLLIRRCCLGDKYYDEDTEPTLPYLQSEPYEVEPHYRRMSQVIAFGNVLSAGAAGVGSGAVRHSRSIIGSDESHARSRETYNSTEPIMAREKNPFLNFHAVPSPVPEDAGVPPYHRSTHPFRSMSRVSTRSAADTSPSIYPPTLAAANEDENYWRRRELASTPDPTREEDIGKQQPTPPYSALGLWTSVSQTTVTPPNLSENELVKGLDPKMEPGPVHKGSTAPIASPSIPRYQLRDEYFLDSTWKV